MSNRQSVLSKVLPTAGLAVIPLVPSDPLQIVPTASSTRDARSSGWFGIFLITFSNHLLPRAIVYRFPLILPNIKCPDRVITFSNMLFEAETIKSFPSQRHQEDSATFECVQAHASFAESNHSDYIMEFQSYTHSFLRMATEFPWLNDVYTQQDRPRQWHCVCKFYHLNIDNP